MKKLTLLSIATLIALGFAFSVNAAPNPLTCFSGVSDVTIYGGNCSIAAGTATLDNSGGDPDGSYSGVYTPTSTLTGKTLAQVGTDQLSFTYTGTPTAGSPRISLPIDTDANGTTDVYAFIGANLCTSGSNLVDPINDPNCKIFITGGDVGGYTGWAAFVAAFPTYKVSTDVPFIIADDAGSWTVSNIHLGSVVADNVTTNPATGITSTDATLNGTNGPNAAVGHSFWVSTSPFSTASPSIPAGVYSTPDMGAIAGNTAFSALLSSLTTSGVPSNMPAVTPNTTYYFVAWSNVGGTWYPGAELNFTTSPNTVTQYTLTYTAGANGTISGTSPQTVNQGANGTAVTAVGNAGYHFVNWSDASTANPRTDTNVQANISVTANFAADTTSGAPTDKDQCRADGWKSFTSPTFKNQGQCVSYVQANPHAGKH
ncbi:MAG: hypothetical protein V4486_01425 [Patescibacteria group bacterium]